MYSREFSGILKMLSLMFVAKRGFPWLLVVLFALNSGCQRFLKDDQKNRKPFELDIKGTECLSGVPGTLTNYFQQKLVPQQLDETTRCVDQTILEFLNSTKGADATLYRTDEVKNFFQKYIFKREISPDLAREIMKLKAAMIGGTDESITRSEFERLRRLLKSLKGELQRLYPHLSIYLLRETLNVSQGDQRQRLDLAIADLKLAVKNLLADLNIADAEYSLPEMDLLAAEIARFAGITDPQHPFLQWRLHIPTVEKLKTLLVGEVVEVRGQKEILEIWDILIDVYRLGLQYFGGLDKLEWMTPQNFPEFDYWVEDFFAVLGRAFALKNKGQIPFSRIDDVIDEVHARGFLHPRLLPETAKLSYRRFISRFLDTPSSDLLAVDILHLTKLHREYKAFKLVQNILTKIFSEKSLRSTSEVIALLENYKINPDIRRLSPLSIHDQDYFANAWSEFLSLIKSPQVRHWDARGRVSVGVTSPDVWNYEDLSRMNIIRVPTSLFVKAYGEIPAKETLKVALTVEQIAPVFVEFRDFGGEMGFFDLRSSDSASRSAREADMFTPSGNGDQRIQFVEMFDLFSLMWSGGVVGVSEFKTRAQKSGCELGTPDYFHYPYLEMACAEKTFHEAFPEIFVHLPRFTEFVRPLSTARWDDFYRDLLVVGRVCPKDPMGLETGDQRTMIVVLHYIENLFAVYDKDRDSFLNDGEVEKAFPRFRGFLTEVTKKRVKQTNPLMYEFAKDMDWTEMTLNVFKIMVFKGRAPLEGELGFTDFFTVKKYKDRADRQNVLKVFAGLKSEISSPSSEACRGL